MRYIALLFECPDFEVLYVEVFVLGEYVVVEGSAEVRASSVQVAIDVNTVVPSELIKKIIKTLKNN